MIARQWQTTVQALYVLSCIVGSTSGTPTGESQPAASNRVPNIVLLYADDLGWTDLGCFGSDYYETPNLDRLCAQGMKFTSAYACAGNCAPSRACLMSGQYVPRHGVYTVGSKHRFDDRKRYPNVPPWNARKLLAVDNAAGLEPEKVTMAEVLRNAGYATGMFGKWHLGDNDRQKQMWPTNQGFDVAYFKLGGSHWDVQCQPVPDPEPPDGTYRSDWMTDRALEFVEENRSRPFFLYLADYLVHVPLEAKRQTIARYKDKSRGEWHHNPVYAAMIEHLDHSFGRVIKKLDELQLAESTLVVFYSDNGGVASSKQRGLDHRGTITSNHPLRGMKGMLYDGGIRVPMTVRWPGVIQAGSVCDVPVTGVDLYATFVDVAGATAPDPAKQPLDGESLVPLLTGKTDRLQRDAIFWHMPGYLPARQAPATAMRSGPWKLIENFEDGSLELYNLDQDIGETKNLANTSPEVLSRLHQRMKDWREDVGARIPEKNPDYMPRPAKRRS